MKFSQNDEEIVIEKFFGPDFVGRFLDIGAYTGKELSNTWALSQRGWSGVLVEPSPDCFCHLMKNYDGNERVELVNALIGERCRLVEFYNSAGACATTDQAHYERWKPHQLDFKKIYTPVLPARELTHVFGLNFDFISIDTEGNDLEILKELPIGMMSARLICIEYGKDLEPIYEHLLGLGYKKISYNAENIICAKL